MPRIPSLALLVAGTCASAVEPTIVVPLGLPELIKPGAAYAVIATAHLRAYVPKSQAEHLRPFVARAEAIYVALAAEAGQVLHEPLTLVLSGSSDDHNGFSTQLPAPAIQVELAPARPESGIFDGGDHRLRTLVHELTHHLSNDRNPNRFRSTLENIFGRVVPFDVASLLVFYLSTPAHQTMPALWQEGLAQWAETTYADGDGPWGGRGRDSLSHMVWRLDAAAGAIPAVDDWRLSAIHWPFGTRAYVYGLAYLRWLDATYGDRVSPWKLIDDQAKRWPFAFTAGPLALVGKDHAQLIADARAALLAEQQQVLARLRTAAVTTPQRLTPGDHRLAAPAWLPEGRLFFAANGPYDRPHFATLDRSDALAATSRGAWGLGPARSLPDGTVVYSEPAGAGWNLWAPNRITIVTTAGSTITVEGRRMILPDVRRLPPAKGFQALTTDQQEAAAARERAQSYQVAAIRLKSSGEQDLVLSDAIEPGWRFFDAKAQWTVLPTQGRAWSPAFRPGGDQLAWVETDAAGSRLVLAAIAAPLARTVLATVRGRILHPCWTADGNRVFVCCDHSGVLNAYAIAIAVDGAPGPLVPVTNTIGGIIACVPSPDGRELAVIDHDRAGPFIARLAGDPTTWAKQAPAVTLAWPAPVGRAAVGPVGAPAGVRPQLPPAAGEAPPATPYRGFAAIRPRFWTPTTAVVADGGYGVLGLASDPLSTHQIIASAGIAPETTPVGLLSYAWSGWPVEFGIAGWQSERTYDDLIVDVDGNDFDYSERIATIEGRLGIGLAGLRVRWLAWLAAGVSDRRTNDHVDDFANLELAGREQFRGSERYLEATVGYADATAFRTSYALEDGLIWQGAFRHSGLGGDLERNSAFLNASYAWSVWPSRGVQVVAGGQVGWSDGDEILQGSFSIGGALGRGLPRGYLDIEDVGDHLVAYSAALRVPIYRPFKGFASSPFAHRQVVVEGFFDAAMVSDDHPGGDGIWFRSAGGELHDCWEISGVLFQPGIGVAAQLDGDQDVTVYAAIDFRY